MENEKKQWIEPEIKQMVVNGGPFTFTAENYAGVHPDS